jgi:molecular chaperone IbpA
MASLVFGNFQDPFRGLDRIATTLLRGQDAPGVGTSGYDIVRSGDNVYEVVLAVPGYALNELELTFEKGVLTIKGEPKAGTTEGVTVLHRGIARGGFQQRFSLADHVEVNGAELKDGLLRVKLVREVPEAMKPRTIAINQAPALPKAA